MYLVSSLYSGQGASTPARHIEAWPADHGYCPALCVARGDGYPQHALCFPSVSAVGEWARSAHPDLPFRGLGGLPVADTASEAIAA
ncbi:MAG TPA: hypothetical protein VFQ88_07300 [Nevskiaceae bacterium]|nr:hypothetical protein [Nevskiaceae bacterium]